MSQVYWAEEQWLQPIKHQWKRLCERSGRESENLKEEWNWKHTRWKTNTDRQTSKRRDKVWDTATHKGLATSEHWLRLKIKDNVIGVGGLKGAWGPCSVLPQAAGWVLRGGCRGRETDTGSLAPKLRCTSGHPQPKSCVYSQRLFREDQVNYRWHRASFSLFLYIQSVLERTVHPKMRILLSITRPLFYGKEQLEHSSKHLLPSTKKESHTGLERHQGE